MSEAIHIPGDLENLWNIGGTRERQLIERIGGLETKLAEARARIVDLRGALVLAEPVLEENLQSMLASFCGTNEDGTIDRSTMDGTMTGWVENCEMALKAVQKALAAPRGEQEADNGN